MGWRMNLQSQPENRGLEAHLQKLNSFAYLLVSLASNFCTHFKTISSIMYIEKQKKTLLHAEQPLSSLHTKGQSPG